MERERERDRRALRENTRGRDSEELLREKEIARALRDERDRRALREK